MPRHCPADCAVLHGPYEPPPLKVGEREFCLFRARLLVVTGWTDAPLSWPQGIPAGRGKRGHPTLIVTEALARAVRREAAKAVCWWWGVSGGVVHRWRRALGVTRTSNEGTARLDRLASAKGADATRGRPLPPQLREARRRRAAGRSFGRFLAPDGYAPAWSEEELALLGTLPDEEVAALTGRTPAAVRLKRERLGIATAQTRGG